ncbi:MULTISPECIES: ATP-dependent Clp protease proteolytic subunit [Streptomyces]|uniref:ATP-dependent Clp protease proteolytic subunit n=1 Tax=Streptomyces luteosporeus TaxID=173856 RepID=A0ABN3U4Y5_9ACTN
MDTAIRDLNPYEKLFAERLIVLGTPIDDAAAQDVIAQLMHLEHAAPGRDIGLYLNSPGGSLRAMSAIRDTMRYVECDIETVCLGQAAGPAAVLLAAGTRGKRLVLPHARVVLRRPALPEPVRGQTTDLALWAAELLREGEEMVTALAGDTGQDAARIRRDVERDTVLDAEAAVAYGLADAVVTDRRSQRGWAGTR